MENSIIPENTSFSLKNNTRKVRKYVRGSALQPEKIIFKENEYALTKKFMLFRFVAALDVVSYIFHTICS